jgi:hypothetical protein
VHVYCYFNGNKVPISYLDLDAIGDGNIYFKQSIKAARSAAEFFLMNHVYSLLKMQHRQAHTT